MGGGATLYIGTPASRADGRAAAGVSFALAAFGRAGSTVTTCGAAALGGMAPIGVGRAGAVCSLALGVPEGPGGPAAAGGPGADCFPWSLRVIDDAGVAVRGVNVALGDPAAANLFVERDRSSAGEALATKKALWKKCSSRVSSRKHTKNYHLFHSPDFHCFLLIICDSWIITFYF